MDDKLTYVDEKAPNMSELECSLVAKFTEHFGNAPMLYVYAPGRVNLIGEHIDYCGYAVFPMAIDQSIFMAVSKREDDLLAVVNIESKYKDFSCDINKFEISGGSPEWHKYVQCGVKGILDFLGTADTLNGLSIAVSGSIPAAAGLSSSSAIVCAAALAVVHSHNVSISRRELADVCAKSERYIGTLGGGMDQAAILLSSAGFAQVIEFNPLSCSPVRLPEGASFVVANSLAMKEKAASSDYNCRVMECRLACRVLASKTNCPMASSTLGDLQKVLKKSLPEMISLVQEVLHYEPYSKLEICNILEIELETLEKDILSSNTRHIESFHLHKRSLHVFSEADRVLRFRDVCQRGGDEGDPLRMLGQLMKESHLSTRDLYECSHPALDKIVELSQDFALGARLTGAGWGGCVVALVLKERVAAYMNHLKLNYYSNMADIDVSEALFSTEPGPGARVRIVKKITSL